MYVSAINVRLLRGRSTPAIRAISLPRRLKPQIQIVTLRHDWKSCLPKASSTLTLFVLGIFADHPHYTLTVDDLALVTNFLYRCSYFHNLLSRKIHVETLLATSQT